MQVEKQHYDFLKYVDKRRWNSYFCQISEVLLDNPKSILVIGIGDKLVPNILKLYSMGLINIKTFDFDKELTPDYLGDICNIDKIVKERFDCIICCQVLEHLPFENFSNILHNISKLLNKRGKVILSLPQRSIKIRMFFGIGKIKFSLISHLKLFWEKQYKFNGQHYWELRTGKISVNKIIDAVKNDYFIKNKYTVFENPYHYFMILEKIK